MFRMGNNDENNIDVSCLGSRYNGGMSQVYSVQNLNIDFSHVCCVQTILCNTK
jgi:hypothetical protein